MKSKPIILKGKDAIRFVEEMNRERTPEEKEKAKKDFERAKRVYDKWSGSSVG